MTTTETALAAWGYDEHWAAQAVKVDAAGEPGRVVAVDRGMLTVRLADGPARAIVRRHAGADEEEPRPTVGDWCVVEPAVDGGPAVLNAVLARRTWLQRKTPGREATAQILAANVDTVALVCGLDRDQGIRSIERQLALVLDGGAMPLVVLNKADLCERIDVPLEQARQAAPGFEVIAVSAASGDGLGQLRPWLVPGSTVALLGPSGVGKSTLINALSGEPLAETSAVRDGDHKGRHTTVRRQLYRLAGGALLVDTPGLRELGAWIDGDGLRQAFADIEELASACRFRDCSHDDEPGCAVRQAMLDGDLEPRRFRRYLDLAREAEQLKQRSGARQRHNSKRRFKQISREVRRLYRGRDKP
jgi:ribosome biogenesis GTPase / thiamine phosphate phosphatase